MALTFENQSHDHTKMEEVDGIIIHTLKSIGCDIDEDIQSICQFNTELTVEAAARCLKTIDNDIEIPNKLPPSMSARFRVGTSLAKALQDLGYRGDVGYQTFLYSNEADIRRVFIFLIEKIPKGTTETEEEALGTSAQLQKAISVEVNKRLASPWTPSFCKVNGICWRGTPTAPAQWQREGVSGMHQFEACSITYPKDLSDITKKVPRDVREYYKEMPLVHKQPPEHYQLAASVLEDHAKQLMSQHEWESEWNKMGLVSRLTPEEYKSRKRQKIDKRIQDQLQASMNEYKEKSQDTNDLTEILGATGEHGTATSSTKGSRFTHTQKLQFAQDEDKTVAQAGVGVDLRGVSVEEQQKKREEEMEKLKNELTAITDKLETVQLNIRTMKAGVQQSDERVTRLEHNNKEKKEIYQIKKKTLDLLPDAENNIAKLQELVDTSAQRLIKLANQWEKHRAPLIAQYRKLKELSDDKQSDVETKLAAIQEIRVKMKEAANDARSKEELLRQLRTEYENMARDVNRSAYTRRILEIVSNIKKQKHQIDQVLLDTKVLQKEMNMLTGKLDRTFTVTDELIFKDAKREEAVRKSYKHLAALHQNCSAVIHTVEETGVILREIRDLEDQVEQESRKNIQDNLSKISSDYQSLKAENTTLVTKLKKQNVS